MPRIGRSRPVSNYRPKTARPAVLGDTSTTVTAATAITGVRGALSDTATTVTATLSATGQRTATSTASTTVTATITVDASVTSGIPGQTATTITAGLTAAATLAGVSAISTPVTVSSPITGAVATSIATSTIVTAGLTVTGVVSRTGQVATVVTAGLLATAGTFAPTNPTVVTAATTITGVRTGPGVKPANLSTVVTAGLTVTAVRTVHGQTSLNVTANPSASPTAAMQAQTSTAVTAGIRIIGHIEGVPEPVTPPERTQRIPAEDRTLVVCSENRVQRIPAEARQLDPRLAGAELVLPKGIVLPGPPPSKLAFNDSFGRGSLGASWLAGTNAPIIASNQVRAGSSGPNSATTYYPALWTTPTGTNDTEATAVLVTAGVNPDSSLGSGLIVRGNTSFDRVEMIATTTTVAIVTVIGGVRATRATAAATVPNFVTLRLDAAGHTYSAYVGSSATVPAVVWVDSGHLIAIDATTRLTGIVCSSAKDGSGTASYGWELDDWTGKDL